MGRGSSLEDPTAFGTRSLLQDDAVRRFASRYVYNATLTDAGVMLPPKRSEFFWVDHELGAQDVAAYNTSLRAVTGTSDFDDDTMPGAVRHIFLIIEWNRNIYQVARTNNVPTGTFTRGANHCTFATGAELHRRGVSRVLAASILPYVSFEF